MNFTKIDPRAITPSKNGIDDAGWDLFALEDIILRPGETKLVSTGLRIRMPFTGLVWPRSGLGVKSVIVHAGCIDIPYRGELKIVLQNNAIGDVLEELVRSSRTNNLDNVATAMDRGTISIPYGKAIAQLLFVDVIYQQTWEEIPVNEFELLVETERGSKGFGSSDTL